MPQIKEIDQQVQSPGPIQSQQANAEDFGGAVARGVGDVAQGAQELTNVIHQRMQQTEVSDLNAGLSDKFLKYKKLVDDAVKQSKPGEDVVGPIMDQYNADTEKEFSSINTSAGQNYYNKANAKLKKDLMYSAMTAQEHLAGVKAVADNNTTVNNLAATTFNDPHSYETALEHLHDGLEAQVQTGQMDRETMIKLEEQGQLKIASNAVIGAAQQDAKSAKAWLDSGVFDSYLGDEKNQMYGHIRMAENAQRVDRDRSQELQAKALKQRQDATMSQMYQVALTGTQSAADVFKGVPSNVEGAKPVQLTFPQQHQMIEVIDAINRKKLTNDDYPTIKELERRIFLPSDDPGALTDSSELRQALIAGKVTPRTFDWLTSAMEGNKTPEGRAENQLKKAFLDNYVKPKLFGNDPLGKDPKSNELNLVFKSWFEPEYKRLRKSGISARELLTPPIGEGKANPNFMGLELEQPAYNRSMSQKTQDKLNSMMNETAVQPMGPWTEADRRHPPRYTTGPRGEAIVHFFNEAKGVYE